MGSEPPPPPKGDTLPGFVDPMGTDGTLDELRTLRKTAELRVRTAAAV